MLSDEGIVHDRLPVLLEDFLKVVDVVVLVGGNQVGHGQDLRVVLVGFGLLGVKRIDSRLHQHVGQDQVLQTRCSSRGAGLVVILQINIWIFVQSQSLLDRKQDN